MRRTTLGAGRIRQVTSIVLAAFAAVATFAAALAQQGPLPPREALARFVVPEDLQIELLLAEPQVRQPVCINFDERGRLWVVQYLQYPHPAGLTIISRDKFWRNVYDKIPPPPPRHVPGEDKITIHEDTNGDGQFDKQTTFVEGLNIVTSCLPGRGGAWVLNPPYLLFYPDYDRDDVPDGDPVVHLEGFGLEDTHAVANSLCWGPDGWLYGAQGSTVTGRVRRPGSADPPVVSMGQLIWRYHPESRRYEIFAEGGGNAFGVEIDAKGRLFSGHNGGDTRGFHYVPGAYLQKGFAKHGPLSNPFAFGYFPPMKHNQVPRFTHTFAIYDATLLPQRYHGKLFGVAPLLRHVVTSAFEPSGSTFATRDVETPVTTSDEWFRPVDVKLGPDGALYIADWYDRQTNHYRNHEGQIDKSTGRVYRLAPKGSAPRPQIDLALLTSQELVDKLDDPNRWQRRMAGRLLADRKDHSVARLLRDRARQSAGQPALEALWALAAIGALDEATALKLLDHADPHVRLWSARLLADGPRVSGRAAGKLVALADRETHPEVLSQLACSARRLPAAAGLAVARGLLLNGRGHDDPYLPLLVWWAIEARCQADPGGVLELAGDAEVWNSLLFTRHIAARLMQRFSATGRRQDLLTAARLLRLAPGQRERALLGTGFEQAFRGRELAALPEELVEALEQAGGMTELLAVRRGQPEAVDRLLASVADRNEEPGKRLAGVQLLAEINQPRCVPLLLSLVRDQRDEGLGMAALSALGRYGDADIGTRLLGMLPAMTDDLRGVALAVLGSRRAWALALLEAVDAGQLAASELPADLVRKMTSFRDQRLLSLIDKHFGAVEGATSAQMQAEIERLAGVLGSGMGDPYQGKKLFATHCGKCHALFGGGGEVGPDLTGYKRDDLEALLLSVVNPSAEIREGFETQILQTRDGRTIVGFVADRDNNVLVLRTPLGQTVALPQDQVEEMVAQRTSLMPEGLLKEFSDDQVRHLFAYLRSAQPLPE